MQFNRLFNANFTEFRCVARRSNDSNEKWVASKVHFLCECAYLASFDIRLWNKHSHRAAGKPGMAQTHPRILALVCAVIMLTSHAELCLGFGDNLCNGPTQVLVATDVRYDNLNSESFPPLRLFNLFFFFYNPPFIVPALFLSPSSLRFSGVISSPSRITKRTSFWKFQLRVRLSSMRTSLNWSQTPIGWSLITRSLVNTLSSLKIEGVRYRRLGGFRWRGAVPPSWCLPQCPVFSFPSPLPICF